MENPEHSSFPSLELPWISVEIATSLNSLKTMPFGLSLNDKLGLGCLNAQVIQIIAYESL